MHIPFLWTVHSECIVVACIHPSRAWISGSFESLRWITCVYWLTLGLYSHPKEFSGNGVRNHVNSKGKIPTTGGSEEVGTRDATSLRTARTRTVKD